MRFAAAEFALVAARKEWEDKDDSDKEEWEEEREKAKADAKVACRSFFFFTLVTGP